MCTFTIPLKVSCTFEQRKSAQGYDMHERTDIASVPNVPLRSFERSRRYKRRERLLKILGQMSAYLKQFLPYYISGCAINLKNRNCPTRFNIAAFYMKVSAVYNFLAI